MCFFENILYCFLIYSKKIFIKFFYCINYNFIFIKVWIQAQPSGYKHILLWIQAHFFLDTSTPQPKIFLEERICPYIFLNKFKCRIECPHWIFFDLFTFDSIKSENFHSHFVFFLHFWLHCACNFMHFHTKCFFLFENS